MLKNIRACDIIRKKIVASGHSQQLCTVHTHTVIVSNIVVVTRNWNKVGTRSLIPGLTNQWCCLAAEAGGYLCCSLSCFDIKEAEKKLYSSWCGAGEFVR